jgi:hypothetical protein
MHRVGMSPLCHVDERLLAFPFPRVSTCAPSSTRLRRLALLRCRIMAAAVCLRYDTG